VARRHHGHRRQHDQQPDVAELGVAAAVAVPEQRDPEEHEERRQPQRRIE
jgi:hypothetical protein